MGAAAAAALQEIRTLGNLRICFITQAPGLSDGFSTWNALFLKGLKLCFQLQGLSAENLLLYFSNTVFSGL